VPGCRADYDQPRRCQLTQASTEVFVARADARCTAPRARAGIASSRAGRQDIGQEREVFVIYAESASDRFQLAQKLASVKQNVARAITEEFFVSHPDWGSLW